jgi:hypothetical protein
MKSRRSVLSSVITLAGAAMLTAAGVASAEVIQTRLIGFEEVPAASSPGSGFFRARIDRSGTSIDWELNYSGLQGTPFMAHIHLGQRRVNGGIAVWLCGNPPDASPPAGTQTCPVPGGTIRGTITANTVVGPAPQLLGPGELAELIDAIRAGVTNANVHTTAASGGIPGGEIRGQIRARDRDHDDDDHDHRH